MVRVQHQQTKQLPSTTRIPGKDPPSSSWGILQIPVHNSVWAGPTVTTHTKPTLLFLPPPLLKRVYPHLAHTHISINIPQKCLLKRVYPHLAHTHISINIPQKCSWEPCPMQLCSNPWQHSQLIKACPQSSTRCSSKDSPQAASQHYSRNWPQGCLQESTLISPSYPQQKGAADLPLINWRARWF